MKLLVWMRHKIKQSSTEPLKEFAAAQSSLDDQDTYPKPCLGSKNNSISRKQPNQLIEHSFSELKPQEVQEEFKDEIPIANGELFHGFLAIGTLGTEPLVSEPATPTFGASLENIPEGKEEVTANDLKLISDELEKFLEAEAEEGCDESPQRSSQVSLIALSGKRMEGTVAEDNGKTTVCPLQGYLFGSSIELPDINIEVNKEKGSLAELFQKTKVADENLKENFGNTEMQVSQKHKHAKLLIKKVLKKLHSSSRSSTPRKDDAAPTKNKFKKVLQMFSRKIHPENSIAERKAIKSCENNTNDNSYDGSCIGRRLNDKKSRKRFSLGFDSHNGILGNDTKTEWPGHKAVVSSSCGKREQWIKSDAEYLVLEL